MLIEVAHAQQEVGHEYTVQQDAATKYYFKHSFSILCMYVKTTMAWESHNVYSLWLVPDITYTVINKSRIICCIRTQLYVYIHIYVCNKSPPPTSAYVRAIHQTLRVIDHPGIQILFFITSRFIVLMGCMTWMIILRAYYSSSLHNSTLRHVASTAVCVCVCVCVYRYACKTLVCFKNDILMYHMAKQESRDTVVGIATGNGLDHLGVGVRVPVGSRLSFTLSRSAPGSTQSPIQWVTRALCPGVKRKGHEIDHSPLTSP
jgi:hypothetical protein